MRTARIELYRAAEARNSFVPASARYLETTLQERDVTSRRRESHGTFDRRGSGVEVTQSQVRQAQIRPDSGLARCHFARVRELLSRGIGQADLETRKTAIEAARGLFVRLRALCREPPALVRRDVNAKRCHGDERQSNPQKEKVAGG